MSSSGEVADFTTGVSNSVMCQHCLQSFEDGTELYYMQDSKSNWGGKESAQDVISTTLERQRLASPTGIKCVSISVNFE